MRRSRNPLAFSACLSLLSLPLCGVHVHADASGLVGTPQTPFTHTHDRHDHDDAHHHSGGAVASVEPGDASVARDYQDAKDVSLLDLALGTFKLPLAIPALILLFALFPVVWALSRLEFVYRVLSGRHTRWRPPLRAPPQPALT